jgi:L-iditol 2-dehydrogenase
MSWDEAANIHGLASTVHALQQMPHWPGETVAVLGPGPAGLFFAQLEKHAYGATTVVLAGRSEARLQLAVELGVDHTINTQQGDLKAGIDRLTSGRGVDVVIDTTGNGAILRSIPEFTAKGGRVLAYAAGVREVGFEGRKELAIYGSTGSAHGMSVALDMVASRRIRVDRMISHHFALDEIGEAFELAVGDAKGDYIKGAIRID